MTIKCKSCNTWAQDSKGNCRRKEDKQMVTSADREVHIDMQTLSMPWLLCITTQYKSLDLLLCCKLQACEYRTKLISNLREKKRENTRNKKKPQKPINSPRTLPERPKPTEKTKKRINFFFFETYFIFTVVICFLFSLPLLIEFH